MHFCHLFQHLIIGTQREPEYDNDNDNDNDKQFIFRHVCLYNIKRDIHYVQC